MLPEVLAPDVAAELVGCAVTTLEEHARSGYLPGLKLGAGWVFPREAFLARLNEIAIEEAARRRKPRQPTATLHDVKRERGKSRPRPVLPQLPSQLP